MNKSTKILGAFTILTLVVGSVLFWTLNKRTDSVAVSPHSDTVATGVPVLPTSSSKYTAQFRAIARAKFIESCKLKVGQQYTSACECGADYLAAHYSDVQLEKAYIEYHSGNKVPSEVQTAYDACKDK